MATFYYNCVLLIIKKYDNIYIRINTAMYRLVMQVTPKLCIDLLCKTNEAKKVLMGNHHVHLECI